MDHVSDYVHVLLIIYLTLSENMLAKEALEKMMAQAGITFNHYQSDNCRFADNGFIDVIDKKYQNITFCGVGVHH